MDVQAEIRIWTEGGCGAINPNVYGHFIEHLGRCVYGCFWVGPDSKIPNRKGLRLEAIEAFKKVRPPIIRWPGGCFADDYHWMDGVGPPRRRPARPNRLWGGVDDNSFGTHEFIELCRAVGAEPYICLNVGSGSVEEAQNWIEYCNGKGGTFHSDLRAKNGSKEPCNVAYWGVGNEPWGCGGVRHPATYADEYARFTTRLRQRGIEPQLTLIAAGHTIRDWNLHFLERSRHHLNLMDMLSIHVYIGAGKEIDFSDTEYYKLVGGQVADMEFCIQQAIDVVRYFERGWADIGIAMDEWGVWSSDSKVEEGYYQQNTLRDALTAACCLQMFQRYPKKFLMSNLAQTANVLQGLFLTEGKKFLCTPTYYVYDMMKSHQGEEALEMRLASPEFETLTALPEKRKATMPVLSASASKNVREKAMTLSVVNRHLSDEVRARITLDGEDSIESASLSVLNSSDVRDVNTFEDPHRVKAKRVKAAISGRSFVHAFPAHSLSVFSLKLR
jgi:alpha-N-arabinofuranosidase